MKKCLKIIFSAPISEDFLQSILKTARFLEVEGTAQVMPPENTVRIIACGLKENVDNLLDMIHKEIAKLHINSIQVEPFIKEKDYRGVFRIIE